MSPQIESAKDTNHQDTTDTSNASPHEHNEMEQPQEVTAANTAT